MRLSLLTDLLRSQRGVALPMSVAVLAVSSALAAVTVTSALRAERGATRDRGVKRAVAAADGGIEVAVYRLNKFSAALTPTSQCVATDASTGLLRTELVQADGWCRVQSETIGDGASFSFRVSSAQQGAISGQDVYQREIVSTGTVNGVNRRVHTTVNSAISGSPLFPSTGVASIAGLVLDSNSRIDGEAASNGDIEVKSNAKICGDAHPGPGESFIGTDTCPGPPPGYSRAPAAQDFSLQQVTIPSTSDNSTLTGVSGWNAAQRRLVRSSGTLTLTGNTYVLCYLEITSNAILNVGTRTSANPLKIYLDSPANCNTSDEGSVKVDSNAQLQNPNSDPTTFQLYLAGTPLGTAPRNNTPLTVENNPYNTWVRFDSNSLGTSMTVYAPNSYVSLNSNSTLTGAVAAAKVSLDSNARIIADHRTNGVTTGSATGLATRQSWVECTPSTTGASPDSGC